MKKPKISIIVSVYNTEKYVKKCIDSLLNQKYKNIEIIIVEDCSTDNSKEIIKSYSSNEIIKIIYNKENKGLSYSRNKALEISTGEYIGFVDSDDFLEQDYYEKMINTIIENKADIAVSDFKIIYENKKTEIISKCYDKNKNNKINFINTGLAASVCNKVFKKNLISKYKFSENKINEDIAVTIPIIVESKKISYAPDCYYNYIQRENSIQNSSFSEKRFDIFYGVKKTLERIKDKENYKDIKDILVFNQIINLLLYVISEIDNKKERRRVLKQYAQYTKKYNLSENIYFKKFIKTKGKKTAFYYYLILKTVNINPSITNKLIGFYKFLKHLRKPIIKQNITYDDLERLAKKQNKLKEEKVKISVIVPNYNYAKYLKERIFSILNQNYKLLEIIILDDFSTDKSVEEIRKIEQLIKPYITIKTFYNKKNSGTPFKQWNKGFIEAQGDYVWIAEADDYCKKNLIKTLTKPLKKHSDIIISYADTCFIDQNGIKILNSIKNEIDIMKTGHWEKNYIIDGKKEIQDYAFLNCTIANVSSSIIKKGNHIKYLQDSEKFKQAGDWLFYVNIMRFGKVAYNKKTINFYRLHNNNVSTLMKHDIHLQEINEIYEYFIKEFQLKKFHLTKMKKRIKFLKKIWEL